MTQASCYGRLIFQARLCALSNYFYAKLAPSWKKIWLPLSQGFDCQVPVAFEWMLQLFTADDIEGMTLHDVKSQQIIQLRTITNQRFRFFHSFAAFDHSVVLSFRQINYLFWPPLPFSYYLHSLFSFLLFLHLLTISFSGPNLAAFKHSFSLPFKASRTYNFIFSFPSF